MATFKTPNVYGPGGRVRKCANVRFKIRSQTDRHTRTKTMHRVQISKCFLNSDQISLIEAAANVHITSNQRDTMRNRCKSAYQHELDLPCNQPSNQFAKILHFAWPSQRATIRQNSTHRRSPASVPKASSQGCPSTRRCRSPHFRRSRRSVKYPEGPLGHWGISGTWLFRVPLVNANRVAVRIGNERHLANRRWERLHFELHAFGA